jgi:hypothetical protein
MEAFRISQELGSNVVEAGMEEEQLAAHPILVLGPKPSAHLGLEPSQSV